MFEFSDVSAVPPSTQRISEKISGMHIACYEYDHISEQSGTEVERRKTCSFLSRVALCPRPFLTPGLQIVPDPGCSHTHHGVQSRLWINDDNNSRCN